MKKTKSPVMYPAIMTIINLNLRKTLYISKKKMIASKKGGPRFCLVPDSKADDKKTAM